MTHARDRLRPPLLEAAPPVDRPSWSRGGRFARPSGWRIVYWLFCGAVLAFLLVPIAAIVPLSFSSGSFLTYPLPGFSLRWYHEVLGGGADQMLSYFVATYTTDTGNWGLAAALGLLMLATTIALYAIAHRLSGGRAVAVG